MSCPPDSLENKWKRLGDHKLHHVNLVSNSEQTVDIKTDVTKLNVYRDMFGVYMSANVEFVDSKDYMEKLPLTGNELVQIKIETPGTDLPREFEFYIYNIKEKDRKGPEQKQAYVLNLCSLEMLANNLTRIGRSLKGKQHVITKQIWDEQFKPLGKELFLEEALTEIKMVSPRWRPVELICWLSSTAVSKANGTPSYVFYENTKGFHFKTIESLKSQESVFTFHSNAYNTDNLDLQYDVRKVLKLRDFKSTNTLSSINAGCIGMQTIYHDPVNKVKLEQQYSVDIEPTLAKYLSTLPKVLQGLSVDNIGFMSYKNVTAELYEQGDRPVEVTTPDWEGRRKTYFNNMFNNRINIIVTGNTMIELGDKVEVIISNNQKQVNRKDSGYYIVSCINDQIDHNGHIMSVELITDGLNELSGGIE